MGVKKQKMSVENLKQIMEYMAMYEIMGKPIEYEILVDDICAVHRTKELFMFYSLNVTPFNDYKTLEVILYRDKSRIKDRIIFTIDKP
jgi:hypothetical protein